MRQSAALEPAAVPARRQWPRAAWIVTVIAAVGLTGSAQAPAPAPPANLRIISALPSFSGVTVFVSMAGKDTNPGTEASPVRTVQRGVDLGTQANRSGSDALVTIGPGVYRETVTASGDGGSRTLTLQGQGLDTVLSGADDWSSGWSPAGDGLFVHAWPYKWGAQPIPDGWSDYWNEDGKGYLRDRIRRSEMVFVEDRPLLGRLALSELGSPGTFHVDEAAAKIYIRPFAGTLPAGSKIEIAARYRPLLVSNRANVTLRNFTIEKGRGSVQSDGSNMLDITRTTNVTVDGLTLRLGAGGGLSVAFATGLTIRQSRFVDNGVKSLEVNQSSGVVVEDSEISRNNWRGWDAEHKGFASNNKFLLMRGLTVRRVRFVENFGHGMWLDSDNRNVVVDQIFSAHNRLRGFYNEANQGPVTIMRSTFCDNGVSGIGSASGSSNLSVLDNLVFDNLLAQIEYTGQPAPMTISEWDTGRSVTLATTNHEFRNNVVVGYGTPQFFLTPPEGWMRWGPDKGQLAGWLATYRGDNNRYYHRDARVSFVAGRKDGADAIVKMDFETWRASYANDPSNPTRNNETNSTWGDPGPLACVASFPYR